MTKPSTDKSISQTLSRGIRLLEILAASQAPMTLAELSNALGVARSITYRLVRTLKTHQLVAEDPGGEHRFVIGTGVLTLARAVESGLRMAALPILADTANELRATTFVGVLEAGDLVCVAAAEPTNANIRVVYREGLRHPIKKGAAGRAILLARPPQRGESPIVAEARERGYARSQEEVETGTVAIAVPIRESLHQSRASIAALFISDRTPPDEHVVPVLRRAADKIAASVQ